MKKFFTNIGYNLSRFWYGLGQRWKSFWENKDVTKKVILTLSFLALYVIMTTIGSPFVKINSPDTVQQDTFFNTLNLIGGGGLRNFSLAALGISPFINASLIMSLLQTRLFPAIHKLSQSGPQGRRKLNVITRVLTLIIAFPQAILLSQSLGAGDNPFIKIIPVYGPNSLALTTYLIVPLILIAGSLFSLFIAEQITDRGIGNGTSLIIFVGMAFSLPNQFRSAITYFVGSHSNSAIFIGSLNFAVYLFIFCITLFVVGLIYNSERHIPIQQTGAGRSRNVKDMGKLPIKLNPGGIMPIIFSTMVISFPIMIARILPNGNGAKAWINEYMQFTSPLGLSLLVIITFFFSYLMGIQQSKIDKISEDFAKNSTFIPGVQPGEQTEDYLFAIVLRLSTFSAFYLVLLASFQYLQILILHWPPAISFGGTSVMILVSVALETIAQFKARLKTTRFAKQKQITRQASEQIAYENMYTEYGPDKKDTNKNKNDEGLLW
ncbi:preprotein translocase SecY subunit [Mycoplasmopsis californica HAZ160_1]|uniref:Protein translocase subunit SecY n=2 Tax=Mycoplasmopsis californica TaxID=2113 RepID=A0A059XVS6_9BACT|nr:preprotein translocase subunit SecY [Mycoplasmopsis californica]AIA29436.1 preprotein translocase subunit SecY [Mycoplasmopsis californica]BAP01115.1 preprotein translocase SecY subunit [Mycoplasmopsis californica HAZ160_1]BBG40981.1 preprotein translocase SecY subunit [Mycoplasmopsis californica]BBG41574.1 preprotein translocase SecY subunit [Mycoplasmopsis californica]BBG42168.1 preprotein translocase SecY subunit [Mycoplasmopsis californica]